jgi:hypothetical protein
MQNKPSDSGEWLWRRKLSADERADLRARPELEMDVRLTAALDKIPDVAVPSNFTARVLADVELDGASAVRSCNWALNWRLLWPRVATAAVVLIFVGISLQRYEIKSRHSALAQSIALVAVAQPLPSVEALNNFDAIQRMSQPAPADGELLAVLQ